MAVPFDLDGGLWLAACRAVTVAMLLSLFGTLAFRAVVVPRATRGATMEAAQLDAMLRRLAWASLAACGLALLAWLVVQAADLASAAAPAAALAAVPVVLERTWFGHLVLAQLAVLLVLGGVLARPGRRVAACLVAALATALQAGHSHAFAMADGPSLLLASDVLHLLAAGAWLGGLLPLLLVVRQTSPRIGAQAARWFSSPGKACVVALAVTAAWQGWTMIASIPGLVGTAYGRMALVKLTLFAVLFGFALLNRYSLAPALLGDAPARARRALIVSIAVQTGFGLAVIGAAALLSSLPPAMHAQPIWPFAQRLSFDAINEDDDFRREVIEAALALGGALALLLVAALARRWWRWPAALAAVVIAWRAVPHFDLLLADATPTAFYRSPTGFAASAIVDGSTLFPTHCAVCHGPTGRGDGPLAKSLPVPPADLTAGHLWMHSDGELFWWLTAGIPAPDGKSAMPGFAGQLGEDQRWDLIDYIRAHNAGLVQQASGQWDPPVHAPDFSATCGDGDITLASLRGRPVRLVIGPGTTSGEVTTIGTQPGGTCITEDAAVPQAYAIIAGIDPAALAGTQFLIDRDGWLREVQRGGATPGWNDPAALAAAVAAIRAHPIVAANEEAMPQGMHMTP